MLVVMKSSATAEQIDQVIAAVVFRLPAIILVIS